MTLLTCDLYLGEWGRKNRQEQQKHICVWSVHLKYLELFAELELLKEEKMRD